MNSMNSDEEAFDLFGDGGGGLLVGNACEDEDGDECGFVEDVVGLA